jgi:hypothetical protein
VLISSYADIIICVFRQNDLLLVLLALWSACCAAVGSTQRSTPMHTLFPTVPPVRQSTGPASSLQHGSCAPIVGRCCADGRVLGCYVQQSGQAHGGPVHALAIWEGRLYSSGGWGTRAALREWHKGGQLRVNHSFDKFGACEWVVFPGQNDICP